MPVDVAITLIVNHVNFLCHFLVVCIEFLVVSLLFIDFCFRCRTTIGIKSSGFNSLESFLSETMAGDSTIRIEKFTGKNSFGLWQIKMKALLKQQQIWRPLALWSTTAGSDDGLTDGLLAVM